MTRQQPTSRQERGSISIWLVTTGFAMIVLVGLAVDLGGQVHAQQHARAVADQAARTGGQQLDAAVAKYVTEVLTAAPTGIAAAKALIPQVWGRTPEDVATLTARAIAAQRGSAEGQDGLRAFLGKREPGWVVR